MPQILKNGIVYFGSEWRSNASLVVIDRLVSDIAHAPSVFTPDVVAYDLAGSRLCPGPIDLQVNGGGGVLFNDVPTRDGLTRIIDAHRRLGTCGLLATVITDHWGVMERAAVAVCEALRAGTPGLLGIHFEGPFINPAKAGIHDPARIIAPDEVDIDRLSALAEAVLSVGGRVLVTLAPEMVPLSGIARLVAVGCVVAAGHSNATYEQAMAGFAAGITGVTHLFNAMSPLESRAPGLVGAALASDEVWCSVIADGHHLHDGALALVMARKPADKLILVSDAMPCTGGPPEFTLYGRTIRLAGGRLVDETGRLAGAHLDMLSAARHMIGALGTPLERALAMASTNPARALRLAGVIAPGVVADMVALDEGFRPKATWAAGDFRPCDV